jgi:hypothetical protein
MNGTDVGKCSITRIQVFFKCVSINVGKNVLNYFRKNGLNGTLGPICSIESKMSIFRGVIFQKL